MKKLISYVKQFVAEFKELFREYDSLKDPVSIEKRQEQKAFIVTGLDFPRSDSTNSDITQATTAGIAPSTFTYSTDWRCILASD